LVACCAWLRHEPSLWKPRTDLGEGLHDYPQQSRVIHVRAVGDLAELIEIVRALHARMTPAHRL
jgi:plasmid stabilization system protein ParE